MSDWFERRLREDRILDDVGLADLRAWPGFEDVGLAERVWRVGLLSDRGLLALFVEAGAVDGTPLLDEAPPPAALGALTRDVAARCRAVPLQVTRGAVVVGMLDPGDTAALEEMSFFTGLAVEPRAVRASVLFRVLHEAYGVPLVYAEPDLRVRFLPVTTVGPRMDDDEDDVLPPPTGVTLPNVRLRASSTTRVPDTASSPLLSGIAAAAERRGVFQGPPATSPSVDVDELTRDSDHVEAMVGRDSLPPQVLPLLVPPFRSVLLFLVRGDVAVGWDGLAPGLVTSDIRGVLLPLTAEGAFQRAMEWRMVTAGTARRPTTVERTLFRFLKAPPPETFLVVPIVVGDATAALLYADRDQGALEDDLVARARQVGTTLADGLAPLVARGALFGPQGS